MYRTASSILLIALGVAGTDVVTLEGTREVHAETVDEAEQGLPEVQIDVEEFAEEIAVRTIQPPGAS